MKKRIFSIFLILSLCVISVSAKIVKGYSADAKSSAGLISFTIESIDFRDDLTRIYGKLVGMPHTSNRIDEIFIVTSSGEPIYSTDIEGVDMKRYFQWEDSGEIEVEIDFPAMKPLRNFSIKSNGPKGVSETKFRKSASAKPAKKTAKTKRK